MQRVVAFRPPYESDAGSSVPLKADDLRHKAPPKTVMAWVIGNASESAHFILQGAGKGAINAVSVGGLFSFAANATDAWFKPNPAAIAAHRQQWQEGAAKAAGIRTYPIIGERSFSSAGRCCSGLPSAASR